MIGRIMVNVSGPGIDPVIFWFWDRPRDEDMNGGKGDEMNSSGTSGDNGTPPVAPPQEIDLVVPRGSGRLVQLLVVAMDEETEAMTFAYADQLTDINGVTLVELSPQVIPGQALEGDIAGRYITHLDSEGVPQGPSGEVDIFFRPPQNFSSLSTPTPPFLVERSAIFGGWFRFFALTGGPRLSYRLRGQDITLFERLDGVLNPGGFVGLDDPYFNPSVGTTSRMRVRRDGIYGARCYDESECYYEYRSPSRVVYGFFLDGSLTNPPSLLACYPGAPAEGTVIDWKYQSDLPPDFVEISSGGNHTCGITSNGELYCWGQNSWGQIGDGNIGNFLLSPVRIGDPEMTYSQVSAGTDHTCAITSENKLYCWGKGDEGRLGAGDQSTQYLPTPIDPLTLYSQISAGDRHTCGITTSGELKCWGSQSDGRLGNDSTTGFRGAPTSIDVGNIYSQVAAGGSHTCALSGTGSLKCWGKNTSGQLGNAQAGETTEFSASPVEVSGEGEYIYVAVGGEHSCAITSDNALKCWGNNSRGQVGDGQGADPNTPQHIAAGHLFAGLASGDEHSCAITLTGELFCWGRGEEGQLGAGSGTSGEGPGNETIPAQIGVGYSSVTLGAMHSCGLSNDGLKCWGGNSSGQLGTGSSTIHTRYTPDLSGLPPFRWHGNNCNAEATLACVQGGGLETGSDCTTGSPWVNVITLNSQGISYGTSKMIGLEGPFAYRNQPGGGSVLIEIGGSSWPEFVTWTYLPGVFAEPYGINGVDLFASTDRDFDLYFLKDGAGDCDELTDLGLQNIARVTGPNSGGIENQQEYHLGTQFADEDYLAVVACPFRNKSSGTGVDYLSQGAVDGRWEKHFHGE